MTPLPDASRNIPTLQIIAAIVRMEFKCELITHEDL